MAVAERTAGRDATAFDALTRLRAFVTRLATPFALGAIAAIPVLLTLPFMHEPFDRDEGAYATIAQGLTHGLLPYRDLFDHKPPGIYGWYALSFGAFGDNVVAPRLMGALVLAAITLLLFRACSMLYGKRAGWLGTFVFALSTGVALINPAMNTEPFTLLPMVAALVAFLESRRRAPLRWCFVAGVFGGLAVMTKPVAVLNIGALAGSRDWRRAIRRAMGRRRKARGPDRGWRDCVVRGCLCPVCGLGGTPPVPLRERALQQPLRSGDDAARLFHARRTLGGNICDHRRAVCVLALLGLHTSARLRRPPLTRSSCSGWRRRSQALPVPRTFSCTTTSCCCQRSRCLQLRSPGRGRLCFGHV